MKSAKTPTVSLALHDSLAPSIAPSNRKNDYYFCTLR